MGAALPRNDGQDSKKDDDGGPGCQQWDRSRLRCRPDHLRLPFGGIRFLLRIT